MSVRHLMIAATATLLLGPAEVSAAGGLAPLPRREAISTHGPFEAGDCGACHVGKGRKPGKLRRAGNDLCFECHEEYRKPVANHADGDASCTSCHSPHNARKPKLLL